MNKYVLALLVSALGSTVSTVEAGGLRNRGCGGGYGCGGGGFRGYGCGGGMGIGGYGCQGAAHTGVGYGAGCNGGVPMGASYTYGATPTTYSAYGRYQAPRYTYGGYRATYNSYGVYPATSNTYGSYPTTSSYGDYRSAYPIPVLNGPVTDGATIIDRPFATSEVANGRVQFGFAETFDPSTARIIVRMPAEARLSIDGHDTRQHSLRRVFVTPQLERNKDFQYTLKAEMIRDGETQVVTKEVTVRAGQESEVLIDFSTATTNNR